MSVQRRVRTWLPCVAVALLLSGCANVRAPFKLPRALVVTSFQAPLQLNLPEGGAAVNAASGSASSLFLQDIIFTGMNFAWDDCSVEEAARNGNIRNVQYADYSWLCVLGIFGKTTVTVYGDR